MSDEQAGAKLASGILPALCTAFTDDGAEVDADRQRVLLRALLDAGSRGFFVCGGTGEGKAMSVPERMNVAEVVADEVAGEVPIILQVGACPTPDAVELAQHAAHIQGIGAVASVAPIDSPNDLDAAVAHYRAIGAATQLPFYVYWLQGEADSTATADRFLDAMGTVPHFAGIKFTDHNLYLFGQLIDRSGGRLNAISGPDEMALPAMCMGADAAIGTTYNIMPKIFLEMRRAFDAGDIGAARICQLHANRVIRILMEVGVIAGLKVMLGWRGTPVGAPRIVPPLDEAGQRRLRAELDALDFEVI
ncbi:MAG: dihydrodipicolinate synthase family protein [Candidatus Latescibacterota bacterium]|jgi:dihydrodipicolinate synthase/N-acetylneuraminate lyase|nr:dihydrodipicolinate synthase family protein [Candidatus Latescibacterota bacterium]